MKRLIFSVVALACLEANSASLDMMMSGKVVAVQDGQSGAKVIQRGSSAKAKLAIAVIASGTQEKEVRQALRDSLPKTITGSIEARRSSSGQVVQSVPISFSSIPDSIRCKNSISAQKVLCQVNYLNEENNWVEMPAKLSGYYSLSVNLKTPPSNPLIVSRNSSSFEFMVEGAKAERSFASFAGLPEN